MRHLKLWNRLERSIRYDQEIADFDEAGQCGPGSCPIQDRCPAPSAEVCPKSAQACAGGSGARCPARSRSPSFPPSGLFHGRSSCFPSEIGEISGGFPGHVRHPRTPPSKAIPYHFFQGVMALREDADYGGSCLQYSTSVSIANAKGFIMAAKKRI